MSLATIVSLNNVVQLLHGDKDKMFVGFFKLEKNGVVLCD